MEDQQWNVGKKWKEGKNVDAAPENGAAAFMQTPVVRLQPD